MSVLKPEGTTIERVRLTLKGVDGATLQTLIDDQGPGPDVQFFDEGRRIKVRASMHSIASAVPSTPPSTHYLRYEFIVKGTSNGNATESDPKSSSEVNALWRMPDGFARYGLRDTGRDDWASRGAFDWLTRHSDLITKIDDISGEHARNLNHRTHERGVDIDIFHFYTFAGGSSGAKNYGALRSNVIAALNGDAVAKDRVTAWVSATRTGLGALVDLGDVSHLYYASGTSHSEAGIDLLDGWAETLIKSGTLTASQKTLDTGAGSWSKANSSKITYNSEHNSHIHIALDDSKLIKRA